MTAQPILLDTDLGSDVDDALALALALASPEVELVAVTCVGRESRRRARITARLLELAGRRDVPVHAGCRVPLLGGGGFNWFGLEGGGILEPGDDPEIAAEHGVDALGRLLHDHDGLEVVAIGPLTNLAVALIKDPDLAGRIRRLTVMGGHVRRAAYGGHTLPPGVDYNLCADPQASWVVLRAGIPLRLVTADVTLQTWLTDRELERLERVGSPFHRALVRAVRLWTPVQRRLFGQAGCDVRDDNVAFLHDPLALVSVWNEGFCRFETLEIETAIENGILRTLERPRPGEETAPMRCALEVEAAAFREFFTARLEGLRL